MDLKNNSKLTVGLISAIAGLLGVIVGALVTGYINYKAIEKQTDIQMVIERSIAQRDMYRGYAKLSAEYMAMVAGLLDKRKVLQRDKLDEQLIAIRRVGNEIGMMSDVDTLQTIISFNEVLINIVESKKISKEYRDKFVQNYSDIFMKMYLNYRNIMLRGLPDEDRNKIQAAKEAHDYWFNTLIASKLKIASKN